jgi:RimJ/RimL family protein N-acetyltransferase
MRVDPARSDEALAFAAARIPEMHGLAFGAGAVGLPIVDSRGRILGAVVYANYQPHHGTLSISAAADDARWLCARRAIDWIFDYAFGVCGVQKLWAITAASNLRTQGLLRAWSFEREALLKRHFGAEDAELYRLFRDEYARVRDNRSGAANVE